MKPPCSECEKRSEEEGGLSSVFGRDFVEEMTYGLFNPEGLENPEQGGVDLDEMVRDTANLTSDEVLEEYLKDLLAEAGDNWVYRDWVEEYARRERAKEQAWQTLLEKVKSGEISPSQLSVKQMLRNFPRMIVEGLAKEGLVELKLQRHRFHTKVYTGHSELTLESEKIIARKVLEEAFSNLEKVGYGVHELVESGHGIYPSHILREYDPHLHSFDMLDVQESLLSTALRDPRGMEIEEDDLKARIPLHKARCTNIILVDISYSMYGSKFKGGVMAALALRQLLEDDFKEDKLHIVAYNHDAFPVPRGEMLKLRPHGNTDIGRAIDVSRHLLSTEEGNRNIFLITDSEPTASYVRDQTPEANAYRAAYQAGRDDVRLNIIMMDQRPALKVICERMARLNGDALVTYVENPLSLKEFIIKTYVDYRARMPRIAY